MLGIVAHALCFGFAGFVAYVAKPNFSQSTYFSWHPTLMAAAFTFLAAEGVLALSRNNSLLGTSSSRTSKVTGHLLMMLGAAACAVLGFLAIYLTKNKYGKPHFATPHGLIGCATAGYILVQTCAGLGLFFGIVPRSAARVHGFSGTFLMLMGTLTVLGGVNSDWFQEHVTGVPLYACFAVPLIIFTIIATQVIFKKKEERKPKKQA
jgi:hypothetical protein